VFLTRSDHLTDAEKCFQEGEKSEMKRPVMSFVWAANILLVLSGVAFADNSVVLVSQPSMEPMIVQSQPSRIQLAQVSVSKPTLSNADKKMLESQLQQFQTDAQKTKSSSSQDTSLQDLILKQRELNRNNANINRLNQTATNYDKVGK
jgi:hypothetical protein